MATRLLKLLISAGVYAADTLRRSVQRFVGIMPARTCVVLYYHDVGPGDRVRFARQLTELKRWTRPIRLDDEPQFEDHGRYAAVTFDDGLASVIENAIPELEARGIPSTHFVIAGALGQKPDWAKHSREYPSEDRVMTVEQLRALSPMLVTVGSHTMTHPMLPTVAEEQARQELVESREVLAAVLRRPVELFSFPYGEFNADLVRWCAEAGYRKVFTTEPRTAFRSNDEYSIGRVNASPTDWIWEFRLKLVGAYRWMPFAVGVKRRIRTLIRTVIRRADRERF